MFLRHRKTKSNFTVVSKLYCEKVALVQLHIFLTFNSFSVRNDSKDGKIHLGLKAPKPITYTNLISSSCTHTQIPPLEHWELLI